MTIAFDAEQRLNLIKNFSHTRSIPQAEILFHLKCGECLHVRSEAGEWFKSYSWNWDEPSCYDWVINDNLPCSIDDIPQVGNQVINGEPVVVCFYKVGELPVFKPVTPVFTGEV